MVSFTPAANRVGLRSEIGLALQIFPPIPWGDGGVLSYGKGVYKKEGMRLDITEIQMILIDLFFSNTAILCLHDQYNGPLTLDLSQRDKMLYREISKGETQMIKLFMLVCSILNFWCVRSCFLYAEESWACLFNGIKENVEVRSFECASPEAVSYYILEVGPLSDPSFYTSMVVMLSSEVEYT